MKLNPIVYVVVGVIILGGLFLILKPKSQTPASLNTQTENQQPTTQTNLPSPTPESTVKTFELVIKGKKLISGTETITVTQDDEVVIKVTADEPEEFHLHGYDKSVDLEENKQAELKFTANLTGRFVYELEQSKTDIGVLEVQPK